MPPAKSAIWNRAEEIVYLLKEGWTLDRLAEKYECHPRTNDIRNRQKRQHSFLETPQWGIHLGFRR